MDVAGSGLAGVVGISPMKDAYLARLTNHSCSPTVRRTLAELSPSVRFSVSDRSIPVLLHLSNRWFN